jgi:hypothetical protein
MLMLLPPSETKRDGGDLTPLDLETLRFPELLLTRRHIVERVRSLAEDEAATVRALKLGPRQLAEVERNRRIGSSLTTAALDRYTGVLYDALDFGSLTEQQRAFAHRHVVVHSALLGPVAALDCIPAYRLSFDSRVPGLALKKLWAPGVSAVLSAQPGLVLDLRSEGYVGLGPAPRRSDSVFLRVVTRDSSGTRRALNHFNKKAKGAFARAVLEAGLVHPDVSSLCEWANGRGFELEPGAGQLELVVAPSAAKDVAQAQT